MAGRPQESSRTGTTYKLAEFMNQYWDEKVGRTNDDVAGELGYRSANIISMWRTGRTRVPLERLPDIARLMKLDIGALVPLWLEQYWGERADHTAAQVQFAAHIVNDHEAELIQAIRSARPYPGLAFTDAERNAVVAVVTDQAVEEMVSGMIKLPTSLAAP